VPDVTSPVPKQNTAEAEAEVTRQPRQRQAQVVGRCTAEAQEAEAAELPLLRP
jgi:hypothetical protein